MIYPVCVGVSVPLRHKQLCSLYSYVHIKHDIPSFFAHLVCLPCLLSCFPWLGEFSAVTHTKLYTNKQRYTHLHIKCSWCVFFCGIFLSLLIGFYYGSFLLVMWIHTWTYITIFAKRVTLYKWEFGYICTCVMCVCCVQTLNSAETFFFRLPCSSSSFSSHLFCKLQYYQKLHTNNFRSLFSSFFTHFPFHFSRQSVGSFHFEWSAAEILCRSLLLFAVDAVVCSNNVFCTHKQLFHSFLRSFSHGFSISAVCWLSQTKFSIHMWLSDWEWEKYIFKHGIIAANIK